MARRQAQVSVTCNITQAQQAQRILIAALESLQKRYESLVNAGKQNEAETQKIKGEMDALSSAVATNEQNMNRIKAVMDNLSGSTLRQLNAALREVKKQMSGNSENSAGLDELRAKYNAIVEQIKILKGETVDITKGIQNLSAQSDAWLTKAIAKQKDLVAQTQQGTAAYLNQKNILTQLQAEQGRRSLAAIQIKGENAMNMATPNIYSASQLRGARQDLVAYRDSIGSGGNNLGSAQANADRIREINELLAAIDKQIDTINGKEQKVAQTSQQIVQSVKQIDFTKATPNDLKAKLDEVNQALANMAKNDPMRSQLQQSARQLQAALDGINGKVVNVAGVLANLDKASPQKLRAALDQVNRQLERMGQNDKNRAKLVQEAERLRNALSRVQRGTVDVDRVLRNLRSTPLQDLKRAAAQLEQEMEKLNRGTLAYSQKKKQLAQLRQEVERTNRAVSAQSGAWQKTMQAIGAYMGITMLIGKAISLFSKFINLNLKFSDQLADIRKVSGLAMEDINTLSTRLASIDTRTSVEELNKIAYAGAKLGMGKYGIEGLEGFTRAANQVNVALKEDLGEDALTALSKITETMGLIPKMGVEKSMLATGSAMFQLSASSTATAGNIVEFSKRLTGLAKVTGITTDQLLGLASASDAMFLMPEVSATAFNKLFTSIQTKHNLIEKELAIDPGTINELYSAGRAMDAIVLIFEKMRDKGNMNALQGVFKDLGSEGARLVNVMVTMAQNVDMLKDHLYISAEAFEEATAVTNEYNIQQETAQALMERAGNAWEKAFVNPEGVDSIKALAQAWYDVSIEITKGSAAMTSIKVLLWLIVTAIKSIVHILPILITFMMFKGVAGAIKGVWAALSAVNLMLKSATISQLALNAAQNANVLMALASVLIYAVTWLYNYCTAADEAADSQKKLNEYLGEADAEYGKEKRKLDSYVAVLNDVNTSTAQRERILKKFNHEYGTYLTKLGIEVNNVNDLKNAYEDLNAEMKKKMYYQIRERAYDKELGDAQAKIGEATRAYSDYVKNSDFSAYDTKWLQDLIDSGHVAPQVAVMQMVRGRYGADGTFSRTGTTYTDAKGNVHGLSELRKVVENYIEAHKEYKAIKKAIDDAFNPIIGDYDPFKEIDLGDLDQDAKDKEALKEAQRRRAEQKRQWRQDLKEAQDEARAVMDNIKNFYQRQITKILQVANEQGWDESLIKSATDAVIARENLALSQARKGIAGVANEWDEFKSSMQKDMIETANDIGYNESQVLLDLITTNNLDALREKINGLASNLGLPANAATDAIWKNATLNEKANETAKLRHERERQKLLLQDNYTAKVDSDYAASMTRLGFFDVNETQAKQLVAGGEIAKALIEDRNDEIAAVFKNAREHLVELIAIDDVTTDDGRNRLLELLFGPDWSADKSELKEVFNLTGDDLKQFYDELIKYDNDYIEARKKAEERAKKLIDFQWERSAEKKYLDRRERDTDRYKQGVLQHLNPDEAEKRPGYGIYGNTRYVADFGVDPEIEAYKLKIKFAQDYYDFLEAHGASAEQLREQEKAVITAQSEYVQQLAQRIKKQMDDVLSMHEPIEEFGTQVGEAFATMTQDAEAGRKAMKAAIADMINSFMKQTVEMTKEYVKRRLMQKIHDRLTQIEIKRQTKDEAGLEGKKQDKILDVQALGGEAREFLAKGVGEKINDATKKVGDEALVTQQTQTQTEVQTESMKAQANVTTGIASGASKIIGSLGWWGIPLVAVITALLNGLLSFAMSKVSSLFGGGKSSADSGTQTKLVSGMLTYDSGNVQAFRGVEDGKTYPVVGNDGKVYAAKDGGELSTGLVKDPITTLVNGQPALVAERGPEIVIGRETTAAMMMARPDILAAIVKFDRQRSGRTYRAYDGGNLDEMRFAMPSNSEDMTQLRETINALVAVLSSLQKDGIPAHINKYGRGGVATAAKSGGKFMQRNSGDSLWRT